MRRFIISEERLKMLLKHEKQLYYAQECVLYSPSEEELKVTDDDLKEFTELEEYIKDHRDEILHDNAEEVRNVELEEDIKHCEEVLADWQGCDECKADHERLLSYMKELLEYRKSIMSDKKYYKISEERLKQLIKLEKAVGEMSRYKGYFALPNVEVSEYDLKEFTEIKETDTDFIDVKKIR